MPEAARRGGRRFVAGIVVVAVVLVALVGLVETAGRAYVASIFADQVQDALGMPEAPQVEIPEGSMVVQLVTQELDRVEVDADSLTLSLDGTPLELGLTDLDLETVDIADTDNVLVGQLDGSTLIPYETLASLSGLDLRAAGEDRVTVVRQMDVFGTQIEAEVEGRLELDPAAQTIQIVEPQIRVGGVQLGEDQSAALLSTVTEPFSLGLPGGLRAAELEATDTGFRVTITGTDVNLNQLGA